MAQAPRNSAQNPDELLSQLAGSEIDRLLAEGQTESSSPGGEAQPDPEKPVETAAAVPQTPKPTAAEKPPDAGKALEASVASELDALFDELKQGDAPAAKPAAAEPPPAAPLAAAKTEAVSETAERAALLEPVASAPQSDPVHEGESNPPERAALLKAAGFESAKPGATAKAAASAMEDKGLPIFLKPLEWMNAPLANCSPMVRQTLGRAGIVTLINAVLVLGYVLIFRKH